MNAKEVTFDLLDKMPHGTTFTGGSLAYHVETITGKYLYPATVLRYTRQWRCTHRKVVCLNNKKSLYQIIGKPIDNRIHPIITDVFKLHGVI